MNEKPGFWKRPENKKREMQLETLPDLTQAVFNDMCTNSEKMRAFVQRIIQEVDAGAGHRATRNEDDERGEAYNLLCRAIVEYGYSTPSDFEVSWISMCRDALQAS